MPARLTEPAIQQELKTTVGWKRSGDAIIRTYSFSTFVAAMAFVNFVAGLAERADHHPDVLIQYNKVTLTLSTHSAKGLTALDFELARKIDA